MSLAAYTVPSDILNEGNFGSDKNTCFWCCVIAAITKGQKFDKKTLEYYMLIFQKIATVNSLEFPKIGEDVDIFDEKGVVKPLFHKIAEHFHFSFTVVQCDDLLSLVFHDMGARIGIENNNNKFYLCLYGRHFYLHTIQNLAPIDEEQIFAIQIAAEYGEFDQVDKLRCEFLQAHQAKLAK
jgi:hypothetical protein